MPLATTILQSSLLATPFNTFTLNYIMVNYKLFFIIPTVLLVFSIAVLANGYLTTGEWFKKSIELKGGDLITVFPDKPASVASVQNAFAKFSGVAVREIGGVAGQGIEIYGIGNETVVSGEFESLGIGISSISVRTISPALGEMFWSQTQLAIIIAFIFMGAVVFIIFRTVVPSFAVILCAFSDIVTALAFMQIFGVEMSLASLAALLMLIGYSVDTDIVQTSKTLKSGVVFAESYRTAFKTGITMTGTTLAALAVLYVLSISPVISQIAAVLLIGLCAYMPYTWIQNSTILKWHIDRKNAGEAK